MVLMQICKKVLYPVTKGSVLEICNTEVFRASCGTDEVIIVETAQYGRLEIGRCVTESFGYLRCMHDVMPEVESTCSGRHLCEIRVDDTIFQRTTACHKDLKSHLWVNYSCRKVFVPPEPCRYSRETIISGSSGILSSQVTEDTGCGTTERPWIISVGSGQRINITLHDFSMEASLISSAASATSSGGGSSIDKDQIGGGSGVDGGGPLGGRRTCRVYATLRETYSAGRSTTVCGSQGRVLNVFTSVSNHVELRILSTKPSSKGDGGQPAQFLFSYEVLGCADPPVAEGTITKRVADVVNVGCHPDELMWQMTCINNQWTGLYENCSTGSAINGFSRTGDNLLPYVSSMVIIIVIAITVVCFILIIGVVCIQWRLRKEYTTSNYPTTTELGGELDIHYNTGAIDTRGDKYNIQSADLLPDRHQGSPSTRLQYPPNYPRGGGGDVGNSNEYATTRLLEMAAYTDVPSEARSVYADGYRESFTVDHIYESPDSIGRNDHVRQYTSALSQLPKTLMERIPDVHRMTLEPCSGSCGGDTRVLASGTRQCGGDQIFEGSCLRETPNILNSYETPSWNQNQIQSWNRENIDMNLSGNYSL